MKSLEQMRGLLLLKHLVNDQNGVYDDAEKAFVAGFNASSILWREQCQKLVTAMNDARYSGGWAQVQDQPGNRLNCIIRTCDILNEALVEFQKFIGE